MMTAEIPGLFDSNSQMAVGHQDGGEGSRSVLDELLAEKGSLGPNFIHSNKLLDEEIAIVRSGGQRSNGGSHQFHNMDPNALLSQNIFIPLELQKQHNVIGRLLGPKGITFKRIQSECHTKMSILGRGSIKDRQREEELRNSNEPMYAHLKEELHVHVEAAPPYANLKLAAGVSEIQKMIIPPIPGQSDPILARYLDPHMAPGYSPGGSHSGPPHRGRGGLMGTPRGGPSRGGPMRGSRGGTPRGRGGRGRGMYESSRGGGRGITTAAPVSSPTFETSSYADSKPSAGRGWQESVSESSRLPVDDYVRDSRDVGYNDRSHSWRDEKRSSSDYGRSSDHYYNLPNEAEPFYSSFSDTPSRGSQYERESIPSRTDYNHSSTSSDWKAPRPSRRDVRSHPYSSVGSSYY